MPTAHLTAEHLATLVLADFVERTSGDGPDPAVDWGVPLLARLTAQATGQRLTARTAALEWVRGHARVNGYPGLFAGGLAGRAIGFAHAAVIEPRLDPIARLAAHGLAESSTRVKRRETAPASNDYDLIGGAAGITLAMASLPSSPPHDMAPLARYLAGLCDADELPRLRVGNDGGIALARWNVGRVIFGLGHGIPGVLAALVAAWPWLADPDQELAARAIRRTAAYLVRHARRDDRGVMSWPFATPPDPPRHLNDEPPAAPSAGAALHRQAWCYGTPGIAWQLTEAGRLLKDRDLRDFGTAAMASLADAWDDDFYLDDQPRTRLAFCHGAAGVLALADAFALHTGLEPARRLAGHLSALLIEQLPGVAHAAATDLTMLNGATGVLAVLLSREPARRDWLLAAGLR